MKKILDFLKTFFEILPDPDRSDIEPKYLCKFCNTKTFSFCMISAAMCRSCYEIGIGWAVKNGRLERKNKRTKKTKKRRNTGT